MTNKGYVLEEYNDKAKVRFIRESACGGNCGNCGGCSEKVIEIIVDNKCGAKKGDIVEVESSTFGIITAAFVLYIIPLIVLMLSYFVFTELFNDKAGVIFGILFFFLSFIPAKIYNNNYKNDTRIIRILKKERYMK